MRSVNTGNGQASLQRPLPFRLGASRFRNRRGGLRTIETVWRLLLVGLAALAISACEPLISPYSAEAYSNATSLKARSLAIVAKSGEPFPTHEEEVEQLLVDVDAAYEFARGNPKNGIAAQQWALLRDPGGGLLGGYMRKWQAEGRINDFVRTESQRTISKAFDYIICLEINKSRSAACPAG